MRSYDWPEAVKLYELCEGANLVFLSLSMFCKESPFVVVFTGVTVLSQCFRGFGVFFLLILSKLELRERRQSWMMKIVSIEKVSGRKEQGRCTPAVLSIDQKLWSLDIEGEKYIDNLWEVVKYKKKIRPPTFIRLLRNCKLSTTQLFFLLICRLIQKNGSKKERKKKNSTFCTAVLKSKTPDRISSVQRYYRVTVKYA